MRTSEMAARQLNEFMRHLRRVLDRQDAGGISDGELVKRYVQQRDETAFEAILRRHGPMVFGVCRRVLHNQHDAEDAFQATFLILVSKAASLRSPGMIGNWLYGVAYRTALHAREAAGKRRAKEAEMPAKSRIADDIWADLRPALDLELECLPDKYRSVIVLCDLEGKTRKEAARHLGLPEGTVASRLARARVMLAKRLSRHSFAISGGALAAMLCQNASASVPGPVLSSTIKAATLFAAGKGAATAVISGQVAALTEGVLKTMVLAKLKIASLLLLLGVFGASGIVFTQCVLAGQQAETKKKVASRPAAKKEIALQPVEKSTNDAQVPIVLSVEGPVDSVAWSPDGKTVATKNRTDRDAEGRFTGSELKLWDARTGKLKRTLLKIGRPLDSVRFSPDGKSLACTLWRFEGGKEFHEVKLWDPETGKEKATLAGAEHGLHILAFSLDGKKLAGGSAVIDEHGITTGGEVYLWDLQTGGIDWQKKEHADQVNGIAFSGDSKILASASSDKTIKLWDVKKGEVKSTLSGHEEHGVDSVAFSSDGRTLASGGLDGTVRIWDLATGKLKHTLTAYQKGGIVAVVFLPDGKILASGGSLRSDDERSGCVKLWDAQTGELKRTYPEPLGFVRAIALSPDGRSLAIGSWDQTVNLWRSGK